jgi:NADH:ubiquinone oxidoreductase subunit E
MQEEKYQGIFDKYQQEKGTVTTMLGDLQDIFGYIPEEAVFWLVDKTHIPASRFYGVTTCFKRFRLKRRGRHTVKVCCGAACHVKGATTITSRIMADFSLETGDDTTDDGLFTIESTGCIGVCDQAPVITVDDEVYSGLNSDSAMEILNKIN